MKLVKKWDRIERLLISILYITMTVCVFLQVVNRNITKLSINWFEELARYCMITIVLLGAEIGLRDGSQMAISAGTKRLPVFIQNILQIIIPLIVILYAIFNCFTPWKLILTTIRTGAVTAGLQIPKYIPYLAFPIVFIIISITQIISFVIRMKEMAGAEKE